MFEIELSKHQRGRLKQYDCLEDLVRHLVRNSSSSGLKVLTAKFEIPFTSVDDLEQVVDCLYGLLQEKKIYTVEQLKQACI